MPSPAHIMSLIGRIKGTNKIAQVPRILVIRKGLEKPQLKKYCARLKYNPKKTNFIAFVSSPYIYGNRYVRSMAQMWFHPFRKPDKYLPSDVERHFMPESDFVDVKNYDHYKDKDMIWDYFYFTIGGDSGIKSKGYNLFKSVLGELSHLKGVVVVYGKMNKFSSGEKRNLQKRGIKVLTKKLQTAKIQQIYGRSRFGFFPNILDCSPRMIPECLVHDTPVVVNDGILGGWKYVNSDTGMFFNSDLKRKTIDKFLKKEHSPRKYFMDNYGFERSATKFASILGERYKEARDFDMIYFSTHKYVMEKIIDQA